MVVIDGIEFEITREQLELLAERNGHVDYIAEAFLAELDRQGEEA